MLENCTQRIIFNFKQLTILMIMLTGLSLIIFFIENLLYAISLRLNRIIHNNSLFYEKKLVFRFVFKLWHLNHYVVMKIHR